MKASVITLSSNDTKEALDLLSLSSTSRPCSQSSSRHSNSDSDVLEDWPEANNMAASIYVALTVDASSFHVSTVGGLRDG
jgi:hypothetical protein